MPRRPVSQEANTADPPAITIDRRARPLRLGFLVDPESHDSVRSAIEVATALWGGRYCPLIPVFKTAPSAWLETHSTRNRPSATTIADGYVRLFEPDYLVETVPSLADRLAFPTKRVLSLDKMLVPGKGIAHGVDAGDLYRALYEKEHRFIRRDQHDIVLPRLTEVGLELLSGAWFGRFPSSPAFSYLEQAYIRLLEAVPVDVPSATAYQLMRDWGGTPLFFGGAELQAFTRSYAPDLVFLVLDPERPADLVDFWNLRALAWRVLPLPVGWFGIAETAIRDVIGRSVRRNPHDAAIEYGTTFIPAQSFSKTAFEAAVAPFRSPQATSRHWYPRLWDEWGRRAEHIARPEIRAGELRGELVLQSRFKAFDLVVPDFARHIDRTLDEPAPSWATVVNLTSYSSSDVATAFPDDLHNLDVLLRTIGPVWVSREGIVAETSVGSAHELWEFPTGRDVFAEWAREHGFQYAESSAGRLLLQVVRNLEGLWGASLVRHVDLLHTLNGLAHREWEEDRPPSEEEPRPRTKVRSGTIAHDALRGVLGPLHGRDLPAATTPEQHKANKRWQEDRVRNHIDSLVGHDVLRLGLRLQCPQCQQRTWYGLDDLGPTLECERCLQHYPFPAGSPREAEWHYRPAGPFAVENYAQGAYAVLLALRFFLVVTDHTEAAAWTTSFKLERGDDTLEVDFGVLLGPGRFAPWGDTMLVLGECKAGDRPFTPTDYRRACELLKTFPGAALAFCTTRAELTPVEKSAIGRIARFGRREVVAERPANPVIVLTRTELESTFPPPMCWRGHPRFTAEIEGRMHVRHSLVGLANATQQLHLDLLSMETEWHERHEKRLVAKAKRAAAAVPEAVPPAISVPAAVADLPPDPVVG